MIHEVTESCRISFRSIDTWMNGDREIYFDRNNREQSCLLGNTVNNSHGDDMPVQVNPSPAKPSLQVHRVLVVPSVLLHKA